MLCSDQNPFSKMWWHINSTPKYRTEAVVPGSNPVPVSFTVENSGILIVYAVKSWRQKNKNKKLYVTAEIKKILHLKLNFDDL